MRILFIAPQPFYEDRGSPIAIRETLAAFSKLGFKVDLATYPMGSDVNFPGIKIFRTINPFKYRDIRVGLSFPKIVLDICLFATVLKLLTRKKYDCIHGVEEGAAIALICKGLFDIPVIYDMQSSLPEQLRDIMWFKVGFGRRLSIAFERWLLKNADCIFTSGGLAPHVLSIEPEKAVFECFYSGFIPHKKNEALAISLGIFGHPTIVYTGNFAPYQGLNLLLESSALVQAAIPEVIFLLVGVTEREFDHYSQIVKKLDLEDTVKLHLRCPRHKIPEFIALADVLILCRKRGKNVPLKIYDYLLSGIPIVATDIPAHRAILNKKMAVLVKPNARLLSKAIIKTLRNAENANNIAQVAKAFIKTKHLKPLHKTIFEAYQLIAHNSKKEMPR